MAASSSALRVLMVTPRYFPYMGGIETHVHEVGRRLARAGADVSVLTTDISHRLPTVEETAGMHVRRVSAWPSNQDYYFAPGLYRVIMDGSWDIIHFQGCHTLTPAIGMLAARRARIPYVVTFHGVGAHSSAIRRSLRGVQFGILRPPLLHAAQLIAVSRFEANVFQKRLRISGQRITIIPNGIDIPTLSQAPEPKNDSSLILSVGRLERFKGHHRVIAAMPKILESRPDGRLLILGSGPFEPALRELAKSLGVAHRVEIRAVPPADRVAMASELRRAALVVLLSESESHPVAIMEALALRRPALVANVAGLAELVEDGLVRGVSLKSTPDELAEAILRQLEDPMPPPQVTISTWDDCASQLMDVYQRVAGRDIVVRSVSCAS